MSLKRAMPLAVTKRSQGALRSGMAFDQCYNRLCLGDTVELWQDLYPNSGPLIFRLENAQNKRRLNYKMCCDQTPFISLSMTLPSIVLEHITHQKTST